MREQLEILAMVLGFIGLFGTVAITAMPMWKVSAFIGANLIVMEELWQGLWMDCFRQAGIRMQCKPYESLLILPPELQAARGLMCFSIALVVIALLVTGCGIKKTNCCGDNIKCKNITLAFGACLYLLSFLTTLIPVCWVAHTIIRDFYNPVIVDSRKRELGASLFVGWATSGVLLATGVILLFSYRQRRSEEEEPYADAYLMEARDMKRTRSVNLERTSSGSHKHHQYV